jgi:RHS repeat-associated protein
MVVRLLASSVMPENSGIAFDPYWAYWNYDGAGNRTSLYSSLRNSTYDYDDENRLTDEYPSVPQQVPQNQNTATCDSTDSGYSANTIKDGATPDGTGTSQAWKSETASGEHWCALEFASAKDIMQVKLYVPTGLGQIGRFKLQYNDGSQWLDIEPLSVVCCVKVEETQWWTTIAHEVVFGFSPVSATGVRYVQDSGGGPENEPNAAYVNELTAYEMVGQSAIAYGYDDNGNTISKIQGANEEFYGYDYANRMNYYRDAAAQVWTYKFAPTGERLAKFNPDESEEWFAYDGPDVIADYTRSGSGQLLTWQSSYVQGLGIDSKIARLTTLNSQPSTLYYVGDALNSVHRIVDGNQSTVNTTVSNAWGEQIVASQSLPDRHGFTQREKDDESALQYTRARMYSPRLGRFNQKDPPLWQRPFTHYAYCGNNPIMSRDPMGKNWVTDIWNWALTDDWNAPPDVIEAANADLGGSKGIDTAITVTKVVKVGSIVAFSVLSGGALVVGGSAIVMAGGTTVGLLEMGVGASFIAGGGTVLSESTQGVYFDQALNSGLATTKTGLEVTTLGVMFGQAGGQFVDEGGWLYLKAPFWQKSGNAALLQAGQQGTLEFGNPEIGQLLTKTAESGGVPVTSRGFVIFYDPEVKERGLGKVGAGYNLIVTTSEGTNFPLVIQTSKGINVTPIFICPPGLKDRMAICLTAAHEAAEIQALLAGEQSAEKIHEAGLEAERMLLQQK